ncbi:hypothetical protein JXI42_05315 [bacterium]|nr:hypothetical protein [bacterium]
MLKTSTAILIVIILICTLSCENKPVVLEIEKVVIAIEDTITHEIIEADEAKVKPGESVGIVLINVSGFEKNDEGMNRFEMDMEVIDPTGNVAVQQDEVLGFKGWRNLEDNVATSPSVLLTISPEYPPGIYEFKVTIYDQVGTGKATASKTFEVITDEGY